MIKRNRVLAGFVPMLVAVGALSGAAAIAEEGVDQVVQQGVASEEDAALPLVEDVASEEDAVVLEEGEEVEPSPPAEEPLEAEPTDDDGDAEPTDDRDRRPRPAPRGRSATTSASAQPEPEGQGQVEFDPESTAGACPGGTAMKIDNLRSNGTFGPVTISDFTNTSFTWTSTQAVSAVLVKDGGGYKTNPGGSSGSASSLGQDISHVIFCLGGEVPDVDVEEPCDADETTPEAQPCEPAPCDADETMPGTQPCEPAPCDADETTPETEPCEPEPCDADETMPGTQPCAPPLCDADEAMPGRQDCTEDVAGVQSKPKEPQDDDAVQGAGLAAGGEPDAPMAAQAVAPEGVLPFTGGAAVPLLMVAAGLVIAGGGAVLIRRP